jgi:hypothetical protein
MVYGRVQHCGGEQDAHGQATKTVKSSVAEWEPRNSPSNYVPAASTRVQKGTLLRRASGNPIKRLLNIVKVIPRVQEKKGCHNVSFKLKRRLNQIGVRARTVTLLEWQQNESGLDPPL